MRPGVVSRGQSSDAVAERALRRISLRVMPFVFLLYIVAFLDRVNVGYAALQMTKDLGFTAEVFGFGAGIFFFGYVLLAIATAFVRTAPQFYRVRFLLGTAEAGFFPGLIVYLSHWFRYKDRAKAV